MGKGGILERAEHGSDLGQITTLRNISKLNCYHDKLGFFSISYVHKGVTNYFHEKRTTGNKCFKNTNKNQEFSTGISFPCGLFKTEKVALNNFVNVE